MTDKKLSQKNWSSWHHKLHKEILTKKILIPKGSNILISVSGGQDSMALLTLINDLKKLHNWYIGVWHGDHQWHEKSSLYALELKSYCESKNIPFYFDEANKENINLFKIPNLDINDRFILKEEDIIKRDLNKINS